MRVFKDCNGKEWNVTVDVSAIKRVRDLAKVDLLTVVDDKCALLVKLTDDPVMLVDVLYVLCKPQADKDGVTDEQFGVAMRGDPIMDGLMALTDEIVNFFPDPRKRQILTALIEKIRTAAGMILEKAGERVAAIDPSEVLKTFGEQSITAPESSESTPAP